MSNELVATEEVGSIQATNPPDEPTDIVRWAIERDVSVEVMERLVALQERVTDRNARQAFVEAITAFREACPPIQKTRENAQFKVERNGTRRSARYAPLEEIDRVARPVAADHGLVWTWDTSVGDGLMNVTCKVLHVMGHSESATVSMPYDSKAGASPQQKYGSAQTYGMRYSLIAALGLTMADEDVDGAGETEEAPKISEEKLADLQALVDEIGDRANVPGMLTYFGIGKLADLTDAQHTEAVEILERKREKAT